jgi:nuclear receptor interaction protein
MVVSWSGEHIYSFDIIGSLDARDLKEKEEQSLQEGSSTGRVKRSKNRKRKRGKANSSTSLASGTRHQSRLRSEDSHGDADMSFRVRYGNGRSEDIPIDSFSGGSLSSAPEEVIERARESVLNEAQKLSLRIAKGLVEIRKMLFSLEASMREAAESQSALDPTPYTASFTSALGYASTYLPQMDEVMRTWRYPLNPTQDDVLFQQALRRNRESSRRFVQACGTLARVLGGRIQTASRGESPQLELFRQIVPAPTEGGMIDPSCQFGYDFLKAILLWLEGGREAIVRGFKRGGVHRHDARRFPIPESAGEDAIEEIMIPYLQDLAGSEPIVNVDASRFEHDQSRILFDSQSSAVTAFAKAVKVPLVDLPDSAADLSIENSHGQDGAVLRSLDRRAAIRFWGLKVGRGILIDVGDGVNFEFVNRAFGGLRATVEEDDDEDDQRERNQEEIDPDEDEEQISEVRLMTGPAIIGQEGSRGRHTAIIARGLRAEVPGDEERQSGSQRSDVEMRSPSVVLHREEDQSSHEMSEDDSEEDGDDDESDSADDEDDTDETEDGGHGRLFVPFGTRRRDGVESHVPCSSHINVYRGHCNVKTVKDVNYFGLDDEYVVSGSDSGHVFIWDRKTSKLVNILEGDSDVVNVVQGKQPWRTVLHQVSKI